MEERLENLFASIKKADAREEVCIIARAIAHSSHQDHRSEWTETVRSHARFAWNQSPTGSNWRELGARTPEYLDPGRCYLCCSTRERESAPETHLAKVGALSLSRPSSSRAGRSGDSADSALLAGQRNCRSNTTRRARSPCTHNRQISGGRL